MNKVFLTGSPKKSPELRTAPKGISLCALTLGAQGRYKDGKGDRQADLSRRQGALEKFTGPEDEKLPF